MFKFIKDKWVDIYSWVDHYWWKNKIDIICIIVFLIVSIIYTLDYLKYH